MLIDSNAKRREGRGEGVGLGWSAMLKVRLSDLMEADTFLKPGHTGRVGSRDNTPFSGRFVQCDNQSR